MGDSARSQSSSDDQGERRGRSRGVDGAGHRRLPRESRGSVEWRAADGCSYALFVFYVNGQGPYIGRIQQGSASCTFTNSTSNDSSFNSFVCNGHTYQGGSAYGAVIQQDGVTVPGYNVGTCDQLFTVQGSTIVEDSPGTATIVFAVSAPRRVRRLAGLEVLPGVPGADGHLRHRRLQLTLA